MRLQQFLIKNGLKNIWELDAIIAKNKQFDARMKQLKNEKIYNGIKEGTIIELTWWWYYKQTKEIIRRLKRWDKTFQHYGEIDQLAKALEEYLND